MLTNVFWLYKVTFYLLIEIWNKKKILKCKRFDSNPNKLGYCVSSKALALLLT